MKSIGTASARSSRPRGKKLRVRSRRCWDMTARVLFLSELPVRAILDRELVTLDEDGRPDFPLLCEAMLAQRQGIALTFMAFGVLRIDGEDITGEPYWRVARSWRL